MNYSKSKVIIAINIVKALPPVISNIYHLR